MNMLRCVWLGLELNSAGSGMDLRNPNLSWTDNIIGFVLEPAAQLN